MLTVCGSCTRQYGNFYETIRNFESTFFLTISEMSLFKNFNTHFLMLGVRELLLVAILEFIEVCISTLNIPQAAKLLTEGDELIDLVTIYSQSLFLKY